MKKNIIKLKKHRKAKSNKIIIGSIHVHNQALYLKKGNKKYLVTGQKENIKQLKPNILVKSIERSKGKFNEPAVFVLQVLCQAQDLPNQINKAIEQASIIPDFDAKILKEAQSFGSKVLRKECINRTDLTKIALCTIDGITAKDFDDAVFAKSTKDGYEVCVAIADVSHYVKKNSLLDKEALNRSTSIYYPGHCIPMLPHDLSNGLCSLKPNVLRLALSVRFCLSKKGIISNIIFDKSLIKSHARLTYEEVQDFYNGKKSKKITSDLADSLKNLQKAALILRSNRNKRGAIDFDVKESLISLDSNNYPIKVEDAKRLESHKIIEDLMVAANELVAEYFIKNNLASIYRVHEAPNKDKLKEFMSTANALGALPKNNKIHKLSTPKDLQSIIAAYEKSSYKDILTTLMLRSMMQARYSADNLKHFGLASEAYTHFTSPIRRYADLIVHRQLSLAVFDKNKKALLKNAKLEDLAKHISEKEIQAVELERKITKIISAFFMIDKLEETFMATVVSCTEFGIFIRLHKHYIEGLVHISAISKRRVIFVPQRLCLIISGSNKKISVGDEVKVKLVNVSLDKGFIDFELCQKF